MHRISRRMVAVVVLIGAIAAGGAAFTAANVVPASHCRLWHVEHHWRDGHRRALHAER